MDVFLFEGLQRAAHCFREGNHNGAESVIRSLLTIDDPLMIEYTTRVLQGNALQFDNEAVYMHFATFRLLRFFIVRHRALLCNNKKKLLDCIFDYVHSSGERILAPLWRSVLSEAALDAIVALKLSCSGAVEGGVDAVAFGEVVSDLVFLLDARGSETQIVFARHVVLHAVEEFGLYHPASRGRGMSLKFHSSCRALFECDGLARLLNSLLCCAVNGVAETPRTVEMLLHCLNSVVSWSAHSYFEEASSENGCHDAFRVSGSLWQSLLLEGVSLPERRVTIDGLLRACFFDGTMCGFGFKRLTLVELIRQFCGVTMGSWSLLEKTNYGERFLYLACCVTRELLESVRKKDEDARAMLPLAISGIRNIVENLEDIFTIHKIVSFCVSELLTFANTLMEFDSQCPDDDGIMAALDESLSCLYKISTVTLGHGSIFEEVRFAGVEVLKKFFALVLSCAQSSEEAEHFSDTFVASRIVLLGHLGRLDPDQTASCICLALEMLCGRYSDVGHGSGPEHVATQEALWLVLKFVNAFLADACEGETVEAPLCFAGNIMSESHPVCRIISSVTVFLHKVMQQLSAASPAVLSALLEVCSTFIEVYVAASDEYGLFFAHGGTYIVSCAVHSLRLFTFDDDVALSGCRVLDVSLKSKGVVSALQSCEILQTVEGMITCGQQFYGNVRGRIAAFWVRCVPHETFLERHLSVLSTFDIHSTDFTSVDVDLCLERCASLSGFFMSLQEGEQLMSCFGVVMTLCDHVLSVSSYRFHEKEVTIRSAELILQLFLTFSITLRGEGAVWMVDKVHTTLNFVIKTLGVDPTWNTDGAEEEKHRLLKLLSQLLCEVSRWTMMECDLSQDVVKSLSTSVISTLAVFLRLLDERCLSFPDMRDSLCLAFRLSAEAFTSEFVMHSESQVFLSTLFFLLNAESVDFQRVGITVAGSVVVWLEASGSANCDLCVGLLSAILGAVVSGKLSPPLSPPLARTLTALCARLPPATVDAALAGAVRVCPEPAMATVVREMMRHVQECLMRGGGGRQAALRTLAEVIADTLGTVRGVLFA